MGSKGANVGGCYVNEKGSIARLSFKEDTNTGKRGQYNEWQAKGNMHFYVAL